MGVKKFKFRLQKFLDLKLKEEDEQKRAFTNALNRLRQEEKKLEDLIALRERKKQEMRMKMEMGDMDAFEMQMYANYIEALKHKIKAQREAVKRAEKMVEMEKEKLMKVMAERKAFEKLKEKHYQRFLEEQEAEERKLIDELATIKFARKLREENLGEE